MSTPVEPDYPALHTVLVSPCFPSVIGDLTRMGFHVLQTEPHPALAPPVCCHADLIGCPLDSRRILLAPYSARLDAGILALGLEILRPARPIGGQYPADTALCAARVGEWLICRQSSTDPALLASVAPERMIDVRQGYARCSTLTVDSNSIITADPSIARAAEKVGIHVLRIRPGFIRLDGYDAGFIGGCGALLAPGCLYLTGKLRHPDAGSIREFVAGRGVRLLEGSAPELIDVGSPVVCRSGTCPI